MLLQFTRKYFRAGGPPRLIRKTMNCCVCTARWTKQTTLEALKLKEQAADYTQQDIFKWQGTKQPVFCLHTVYMWQSG